MSALPGPCTRIGGRRSGSNVRCLTSVRDLAADWPVVLSVQWYQSAAVGSEKSALLGEIASDLLVTSDRLERCFRCRATIDQLRALVGFLHTVLLEVRDVACVLRLVLGASSQGHQCERPLSHNSSVNAVLI